MNASQINKALEALKRDPVMHFLGREFGQVITIADRFETDHAKALALLVVEQQVSFKAAFTIKQRFLAIIEGVSHNEILSLDNDLIQSAGLSRRKVEYIKNIYRHFIEKSPDYTLMTPQEISKSLIQIKGVGKWTIEMFLIFILGEPDIFSKGDLALINSVKKNYNLDPLSDHDLDRLIQSWRPHNTVASLLLWRSVEQKVFYSSRE